MISDEAASTDKPTRRTAKGSLGAENIVPRPVDPVTAAAPTGTSKGSH